MWLTNILSRVLEERHLDLVCEDVLPLIQELTESPRYLTATGEAKHSPCGSWERLKGPETLNWIIGKEWMDGKKSTCFNFWTWMPENSNLTSSICKAQANVTITTSLWHHQQMLEMCRCTTWERAKCSKALYLKKTLEACKLGLRILITDGGYLKFQISLKDLQMFSVNSLQWCNIYYILVKRKKKVLSWGGSGTSVLLRVMQVRAL